MSGGLRSRPSTALPPEHQQPIVADGRKENDAGNDLLDELRDAQQRQPEQHRAEEEGADAGPNIEPTPPARLTPPITAAAIAVSSMPVPSASVEVVKRATMMSAVTPAQKPAIA